MRYLKAQRLPVLNASYPSHISPCPGPAFIVRTINQQTKSVPKSIALRVLQSGDTVAIRITWSLGHLQKVQPEVVERVNNGPHCSLYGLSIIFVISALPLRSFDLPGQSVETVLDRPATPRSVC